MGELVALTSLLVMSWAPAVWLFCAWGAGRIARSKGYDSVAWFFAGLLFGPLAVLVVGLTEPQGRHADELRREARNARVAAQTVPTPRRRCEEPKTYEIP